MSKSSLVDFSKWLATPSGQALTNAEMKYLQPLMENVYGDRALLLASFMQWQLKKILKTHSVIVSYPFISKRKIENFVVAKPLALPFLPQSVDVVVIPHLLEFVDNPHWLLREVDIVIRPQGYVVIIGFNPFSLWGLRKMLIPSGMPFAGQFFSPSRLHYCLALLNFTVINQRYYRFLPFWHDNIIGKLGVVEKLAQSVLLPWGSIYIMIARKKLLTMTPLRLNRRKITLGVDNKLIKPAVSNLHYENNC